MPAKQLDFSSPMARRSDPESSHVAATRLEASGQLGKARSEALVLVRRHPYRTARELAAIAYPDDELGADRCFRRIGRRLSELRTAGLVERFDHANGSRWVANPKEG